jgi:hypothetical protein
LYECSYGFINGEAGGSATDGKMRILIKSWRVISIPYWFY